MEPATARQRVDLLFHRDPQHPVWAIRPATRGDSKFLGLVVLDAHHDEIDTEVSYLVLPEHWGRGYATCAVRSALHHAFRVIGLARVLAETQARNLPSVRLLQRVGMLPLRHVVRFGEFQSVYAMEATDHAHAA